MRTREIPQDEWVPFFDSFSRQHEGWLVSIEVFSAEIGAQVEVRDRPLGGIAADRDADTVSIFLRAEPGSHLAHVIAAPSRIRLEETAEGAHAALQVESAGGATTLVRFRSAVLPETVDGIPRPGEAPDRARRRPPAPGTRRAPPAARRTKAMAAAKSAIRLTRVASLLGEIEQARERITARAYEISQERPEHLAGALDDWLQAEREELWQPAIEMREVGGELVVEAAIAGVEAADLDVQITPDDLVIKAPTLHRHTERKGTVHACEFKPGQLFRYLHFPCRVEPEQAKADYRNGLLRLRVPVAANGRARTVKATSA